MEDRLGPNELIFDHQYPSLIFDLLSSILDPSPTLFALWFGFAFCRRRFSAIAVRRRLAASGDPRLSRLQLDVGGTGCRSGGSIQIARVVRLRWHRHGSYGRVSLVLLDVIRSFIFRSGAELPERVELRFSEVVYTFNFRLGRRR